MKPTDYRWKMASDDLPKTMDDPKVVWEAFEAACHPMDPEYDRLEMLEVLEGMFTPQKVRKIEQLVNDLALNRDMALNADDWQYGQKADRISDDLKRELQRLYREKHANIALEVGKPNPSVVLHEHEGVEPKSYMAVQNLQISCRASREMLALMNEQDELPAWCEQLIAEAKANLTKARDYIMGEKSQEDE